MICLNPRDIERFRKRGFLVVPDLMELPELARLRELFLRMFARRAGRETGHQFDMAGRDADDAPPQLPQIIDPFRYTDELNDTSVRDRAYAIAVQLLGASPRLEFEHAILKPPYDGAVTSWHQDEAYWDPAFEYQSLSVWVPLQGVGVDNGCMHFMPESHLGEVQSHHSLNHDPTIHALCVDDVDAGRAVACPIEAGSVTVHHCRTLHYAGSNSSREPRLAYVLVFGFERKLRRDGRTFGWLLERRTAASERMRNWEALHPPADLE